MARIPEAEIERIKREVSVQRLVEAAGILLTKSGKDLTRVRRTGRASMSKAHCAAC